MLPTHSASKGGGLFGSNNGLPSLPVVNKMVLASLLWVLLSVGLTIYGFRDCSNNAYSSSLKCDEVSCVLNSMTSAVISGGPEHHTNQDLEKKSKAKREMKVTEWARSDFISVDVVAIDNWGAIADTSNKSKREVVKMMLGSNVRLKFRQPVADGSKIKTDRIITLTHQDLGKRPSKTHAARIQKYIDKRTDSVSLNVGRGVTVKGVLYIFFGIISLIMSCLFGQWSDPAKKRLKKKA